MFLSSAPLALCDVISVVTEFMVRMLHGKLAAVSLLYPPQITVAAVRECLPRGVRLEHACAVFKPAGMGSNGFLECKFLLKNEHRTSE
jgi:hypothetical protein